MPARTDPPKVEREMRLELGRTVRLADGAEQQLVDVVIDSGAKRVTHLVVQPRDHGEEARLVPVGLAEESGGGASELALRCNAKDLERFDLVHEFEVLHAGERPKEDPKWDVGVEDIVVTPSYVPTAYGEYGGALDSEVTVSYDRVPKGEIELRRASSVYSADGHHLGSIEGVDVSEGDRLTHLFFQRGHLWWKREVTVPAESISKFESDTVTLGLKKDELGSAQKERVSGP
jgi:sporulation protein YlmC with PRC-barrel domain